MPEPRGEFARIAALIAGLPPGERVVVGPGDDAAVLRSREGYDLAVTTDTFVEGRHFVRELVTPAEAGARLALANLSDLAAMAAEPRWALVSLVVPAAWTAADCQALERACAQALAAEGAAVVGGNLASASSPAFAGGPLVVTLTLVGEVEPARAWTRSAARAGDVLAVTGVPGSAAAALTLACSSTPPSWAHVPDVLRCAFVAPACRVRFARELAHACRVQAAIDLSDGLVGDLARMCEASGVGARLDAARLPASEALRAAARQLANQEPGLPPADDRALLTRLQLSASDDYELLLAVDPAAWAHCAALAEASGTPLAAIGELTAAAGLRLRDASGAEQALEGSGWDHFPGRS